MAYIDRENDEVYLTSEEEQNEKLEGKLLLYENTIKFIDEMILDAEEEKRDVRREDIKLLLNDLKGELASV